jgi:hypothetical protein
MLLQWVATEMLTGEVIADLPDFDVQKVARSVGGYQTTTGTLPIPTAPINWLDATLHGAVNMVLLQDGNPIWGGMVSSRTRGEGDTVQISLATLEAYFDRRFVGDVTFAATGQDSIVGSLVAAFGGDAGGIPIRVQVVGTPPGTPRDRTYQAILDKTTLSALTDLMGISGGPEWTIGWEHQSSPERYTPVLYVGDRIGNAVTPGLAPNATFDMPGCITTFSLVEDYSTGKGANSVMAVSTAQGNTRPQSPPQIAVDPHRPTFEYRWTPSTSTTDVGTLTAQAAKALAVMSAGSTVLSLSATVSNAPVLGVDWSLGDDVGVILGGLDANGKDTVPSIPGGLSVVARAIGWEMTLSETPIITPILVGATLDGN